MNRVLTLFGILIATLCCAIAFSWFALPGKTASVLLALNNYSASLSAKTIETPIGEIHYLEGGSGEIVLLVHGIYARKEHWVEMAKPLVRDYRVIILDLPGFGDNELLDDEQYHLANQSKNFGSVMDALDLDQVHIGANSMGALVTGLYAASNPDRVASLSFIGSPLGVRSPIRSDMDQALAEGVVPLLVKSPEDFHRRNEWLSPNTLKVPNPVLRTWMNKELAQAEKNAAIWQAVHDGPVFNRLLELADGLTIPTLIVWCKHDRIFHVSGAHELDARLTNSHLTMLDRCGHVPMLDMPFEVASIIQDFLRTLRGTETDR